jgi:plasmid stabilization system protein ParE
MTKPLRIVDAVADHDLPALVDYHRLRSKAKAERLVAEYDRIVELLAVNPHLMTERSHGWRIYPFQAGTYLLYYREFETYWLVAGIFHALRDPDWILSQALIREAEE